MWPKLLRYPAAVNLACIRGRVRIRICALHPRETVHDGVARYIAADLFDPVPLFVRYGSTNLSRKYRPMPRAQRMR